MDGDVLDVDNHLVIKVKLESWYATVYTSLALFSLWRFFLALHEHIAFELSRRYWI